MNQLLMKDPSSAREGNKSQQAYDFLLDAITSGTYPAGTRLSERSLQNTIGISRTPIRSALEKLALEGYLETDDSSGLVVSRVGFADIIEICELRDVIEQLSVRLACARCTQKDIGYLETNVRTHRKCIRDGISAENIDAEFHLIIARASRNQQIPPHLEQLISQSRRASVYLNITSSNRVEKSVQQHEQILQYLKTGDADSAAKAMSDHLQDVIATTKDHMAENYFMYR